MRLHEWKIGSFLPLRLRVKHPGETELRVKPAEEAVEGRGRGFVGRVHRGSRVDRYRRVTRGGLAGDPGGVRVGVGPGPGLQGVVAAVAGQVAASGSFRDDGATLGRLITRLSSG